MAQPEVTPLEELQAAHKRLSELREGHDKFYAESETTWFYLPATAEYQQTLHRTIDAQLELLESAMRFLGEVRGGVSYEGPAFTLARAINGESS